jgi:hypothetical protein
LAAELCAAVPGLINTERYPDIRALVGRLEEAKLVSLDEQQDDLLFKIDDVVRRLLALELAFDEPDQYEELRSLAHKIFDRGVRGLNPEGKPTMRPTPESMLVSYMIESLFQLLKLEEHRRNTGKGLGTDQVVRELVVLLENDYLPLLEKSTFLPPIDRARQLQSRMERDDELSDLARALLGDYYEQVTAPVEQFIAR